MKAENSEEDLSVFAFGLLRRDSSKKSHNTKYQHKVDFTNYPQTNYSLHGSKVPLVCPRNEKLPLHLVSNSESCTEKLGLKFISDRKMAYAEMSRTADGSKVLLEDCSDGQSVIPGWDHVDEITCVNYSEKHLSSSNNFNDLCRNNLNYADIDFFPTQSRSQIDPAASSRTKYACIDFNKTLAIHKTGKELLQERNVNASNRSKITSNSSTPLKKASSCFYVSTPTEYFGCIESSMKKTDLTSSKSNAFIKLENQISLSSKPQRKFSLDFVDSSRYPNTLPHSKKKFD